MLPVTSASPSPKSPEVSEKSRKYDRQLRLWGDHGQSKLESSKICLINANATGTEILKSLVLPGCGSFTVIDDKRVSHEDIGNNFFLDVDCLGNNRGERAQLLLLELNPEVSGEAIDDNVQHVLEQDPNFFNNFDIVIASDISEKDLNLLSKRLWDNDVPFVYCQCLGLIGWIRVQKKEHTIIESHPDSIKEDLRLDVPFPELLNHVNSIILEDREQVIKTPWLIVLMKVIHKYTQENNIPTTSSINGNSMDTAISSHPCSMTSSEKKEFKEYVANYLRSVNLDENDELFQDTMRAMNNSLTPTLIPAEIQAILDDKDATVPKSSKFWVMCSALKEFVSLHGFLPVRGSLPDMTADSQKYISLQNVYRDKADKDAEDVHTRCQQLLHQNHLKGLNIKNEEVRLFCKESYNLRVIRGSSLYEELNSAPTSLLEELSQNMEECDEDKVFYVMLRCVLQFHKEYQRYPGALTELAEFEPDISKFKPFVARLLNTEWNSQLTIKDDYIHEICRYGGSEIPSVAAFVGGCAAQEVIKLVTSQYVPINNTVIYNAINSTTTSFRM